MKEPTLKKIDKDEAVTRLDSRTRNFEKVPEDITEWERELFFKTVSIELDEKQKNQILTPPASYPRQTAVLAAHWHPEHVSMSLIRKRIENLFPNAQEDLIIPTQHNDLLTFGDYAGVEVDCFSRGFNQKVQLLLHFEKELVENAHTLKDILAHTFKYRSSQLFDFMRTITRPDEERLEQAAAQTGAGEPLIQFVRAYVTKIERMVEAHYSEISPMSVKNKLLRNYFDGLRPRYGDSLVTRAQTYLNVVKKIVKAHFSLDFFYRTSEIIEEARSLGAGIVIPHPEQFWPVLLADYDIDGVEVWNPQSQRYTEFLISVINEKNHRTGPNRKPVLIFMGDDTHFGEKARDPRDQNPVKAAREIGFQPAWDDMVIRKTLIKARCSRRQVIAEYKQRLAG